MDVVLTDSHLDTRIRRYNRMNVIVPKLEYAQVWEGKAQFVKQLETVHMPAAKKNCCGAQVRRIARANLGMHPLKTNRDKRLSGNRL